MRLVAALVAANTLVIPASSAGAGPPLQGVPAKLNGPILAVAMCYGSNPCTRGHNNAWKGAGKVTSTPQGIQCPPSCSFQFRKGTSVKLTAWDGKQQFKAWAAGCPKPDKAPFAPQGSGNGSPSGAGDRRRQCMIAVQAPTTVAATFYTPSRP